MYFSRQNPQTESENTCVCRKRDSDGVCVCGLVLSIRRVEELGRESPSYRKRHQRNAAGTCERDDSRLREGDALDRLHRSHSELHSREHHLVFGYQSLYVSSLALLLLIHNSPFCHSARGPWLSHRFQLFLLLDFPLLQRRPNSQTYIQEFTCTKNMF